MLHNHGISMERLKKKKTLKNVRDNCSGQINNKNRRNHVQNRIKPQKSKKENAHDREKLNPNIENRFRLLTKSENIYENVRERE